MAGDALKRLAGPAQLANAAATIYTTPAATTTTIRDIELDNPSGLPITVTISIGADAAGTRVFSPFSVGPATHYQWTGTIVLAATEIVQAYASTAATVVITMSGVEST
jgi:hypothetical protein